MPGPSSRGGPGTTLLQITYLTACCTPMNASCYLFSEVNQSVPNFHTMSKTNKLQLLLFGFPDIDHYEINKNVAKAVPKFSLKTKRFLIRQ